MKKLIGLVIVVVTLLHSPIVLVAADEAPKPTPPTLDQYISEIFGSKAPVAKAVIMHESNLKLDSINYNCIYGGKSTFCKKIDRKNAWSVDCGIAQINVRGTVCPKKLLTLEGNMQAVAVIYKTQGLSAWASYNNGAYKQYLN